MTSFYPWIAVGVGGALGAMARHGVGVVAMRALGPNFPWGTLAVNVAGGLAMGLFIAWMTAREPHNALLRSFVAVGLLGGFTTFSSFALEAVTLWRDRSANVAALYVLASVALSIGALLGGIAAGRSFS
ncbi:MAG TPA: fluoride efflux transporter CrcB [Parvularcula sp.]|nr:fluoride efflux transporter CrcB [Parvularcula sp.]HBS31743.1 fluoride efflux transporter CrcB [Parvularcula sp.]HBS34342.1 fluoride efflux transporter CrcB [Parvularcula sp.]